ncbi:unnamed protein product, partial [Prorocentrum cordatum]
MFSIARDVGVFTPEQAKLLLTVTSISMACTPFVSGLGQDLARCLSQRATPDMQTERYVQEEKVERARVVVCGYGRVGELITDILDTKFIPWVAFDISPAVVRAARAKDLPVFLGRHPDPAHAWCSTVSNSQIAVVTPSDITASTAIVQAMRANCPEMAIIARATSETRAKTLMQWDALPVVAGLPEDTVLMNLPIGATVLQALGYAVEDSEAVIDDIRQETAG